MNSEGDGAVYKAVNGFRCQCINRKTQLIRDAANHVAQQMEAVNCHNLYADRIENLLILHEIY